MRLPAFILLLVCLGTTADGAEWDLLIPHEGQSSRLRLEVTVDGKSPEIAWESFLDKLFRYFDRDHDGKLSAEEAKRVFPLPRPGFKELACDFQNMNKAKNGWADLAEFKAFYRDAGFRPLLVKIIPPTNHDALLGETLFHHLDRDGDGKLTIKELQSAWKLLRRFDENEDELLTPAELLPEVNKIADAVKIETTSLKVIPAEPACIPLGMLAISLVKQGAPTVVATIAGKKREGLGIPFELARHQFRVGLPENPGENLFATSRQFYRALFKSALGTRKYLEKSVLEQDLTLRVLASFFDAADHNGDGQLTLLELDAFFDLIEAGLTSQVLLTMEDQGPNLFEWLDDNGTGQLDFRKLNRAVHILGEGKPAMETSALPSTCRITARIGGILGGRFGPVPIAAPKKSTTPKKEAVQAGPRWFQAMDRNGDGFISRQEFIGSTELFNKLDLDGDGQISLAESEKAELAK